MCLAIPLKLVEINGNKAIGEAMGMQRELRVDFIDKPQVGEYVTHEILIFRPMSGILQP